MFKQMITKEEACKINARVKPIEQIRSGTFGYNDYSECENVMKRGIRVIKHNYTRPDCKPVLLKLSQDCRSLTYSDLEPKNRLVSFFKGTRVIPFSKVKGFLFGAVSETFELRS